MTTAFNYPGSKSRLADWIISYFPEHRTYVEVFGGSGAVLLSKQRSYIETYNDINDDIVHFFETLQEKGDELSEWLEQKPYSRSLHGQYVDEFHDGYRPDDDVERAGRYVYLRQTGFINKKMGSLSIRTKERDNTKRLTNWPDKLRKFRERMQGVCIECLDYSDLFEKWDHEDALFYCDPPYVDAGDSLYEYEGSFNHSEFADCLNSTEGKWVVSYGEVPEGLEEYTIIEKKRRSVMSSGSRSSGENERNEMEERLIMNFDPSDESMYSKSQSVKEVFW